MKTDARRSSVLSGNLPGSIRESQPWPETLVLEMYEPEEAGRGVHKGRKSC